MLVVTPRPYETESLMGYVLRLTESNGYPTISYVVASLSGAWYRSRLGHLQAAGLADIAGLTAADIDRMTMRPASGSRGLVRLRGLEFPNNEVTLNRTRVCPECIREHGFCEAFWDLTQARACPRHGCWLLTICPGCTEPLRWTRSRVDACSCGYVLTQAPLRPAPKALVDLMAALRARLYQDIRSFPSSLSHLSHLSCPQLCRLMWVLCLEMAKQDDVAITPRQREKLADHVPSVATALSNWPINFQAMLQMNYGDKVEGKDVLPNFLSVFSWALTRFPKQRSGYGAGFDFVLEQIFSFGCDFWPPDSLGRSSKVLPNRDRFRWGTLADAAKHLRLHMKTTADMVRAGRIPARRMAGDSRKRAAYAVDMAWVRAQQLSRHLIMKPRQASQKLKLPARTLDWLREQGAIKTSRFTVRQKGFAVEDLDEFQSRLRELGRGLKRCKLDDAITLEAIKARPRISAELLGQLINSLLSEPGKVLGRVGPGILDLQVSRNHLLALHPEEQADQAQWMSQPEAAAKLGCSGPAIQALLNSGLLKRRRTMGRGTVHTASLASFNRRYVLLNAIAKSKGAWIRTLTTLARRSNIPLILAEGYQAKTPVLTHASARELERAWTKQRDPQDRNLRKS